MLWTETTTSASDGKDRGHMVPSGRTLGVHECALEAHMGGHLAFRDERVTRAGSGCQAGTTCPVATLAFFDSPVGRYAPAGVVALIAPSCTARLDPASPLVCLGCLTSGRALSRPGFKRASVLAVVHRLQISGRRSHLAKCCIAFHSWHLLHLCLAPRACGLSMLRRRLLIGSPPATGKETGEL